MLRLFIHIISLFHIYFNQLVKFANNTYQIIDKNACECFKSYFLYYIFKNIKIINLIFGIFVISLCLKRTQYQYQLQFDFVQCKMRLLICLSNDVVDGSLSQKPNAHLSTQVLRSLRIPLSPFSVLRSPCCLPLSSSLFRFVLFCALSLPFTCTFTAIVTVSKFCVYIWFFRQLGQSAEWNWNESASLISQRMPRPKQTRQIPKKKYKIIIKK